MSNQLVRFNRVRYTIYGNSFGVVKISEPRGWQDDEKELLRSEKFFGITANLSNSSLQFYGRAFNALKSEYDINGIKAVVRIEREERNENTDQWELNYVGYFDFATYRQNKNFISIKISENEFFKNIESRFKDLFELERLDDLKGGVLPPLQYKNISLQGRDIYRESLFDNDEQIIKLEYKGSASFNALKDIVLPLNLKYRSDENVFSPTTITDTQGFINLLTAGISRSGGNDAIYPSGLLYYLTSPQAKTINLDIKINFRAKFYTPNPNFGAFRLFHDVVRDDGSGNLETAVSVALVDEFLTDSNENIWFDYSVNYNADINLLESDSLGLRVQPYFGGSYLEVNQWDFEFSTIEIKVVENDIATTTDCKALTYYQVFERLIQIITSKNTFSSDLLSNEWRDLLFTNGFKIRQFTDKNITTSLEEVYNSLNSIEDIGLFIKGNQIKVEKKDRAFDKTSIHNLGKVSNIERNIEEKHHYSTIEIGNDFNGVYEEVVGLDEYNIRTSYTTCLDSLDNKFSAISKVRFDSYGITLAQEKPVFDFPKLDTKYDKFNFAIDCKLVNGNNYVVRHWADDFAQAPTGIYSPSTAFNLRLSPFNSLLRKSKTISTGLQKYPTELLKYSSTEGNSQLVTLYPERAIIQNNVLSVPYFLPETITFDKKLTMTEFNNIVNNPYKLIKFVNEFGNEEYAYIFPSVKPNKEGKFVVIKANV